MPAYKRGLKIGTNWNYREAALGDATTKGKYTDKDYGKALKLNADSTYVLCSAGDQIEEIFYALASQQSTVNDGYQIGTICDDGQFLGIVDNGTVAVKDYLVSGDNAGSLGESIRIAGKETTNYARVRKYTPGAEDPAKPAFAWRVVSILSGSGGVGSVVLAERVR